MSRDILFYDILDTPIGEVFASWDGRGLTTVHFCGEGEVRSIINDHIKRGAKPQRSTHSPHMIQLKEYFQKKRKRFDLHVHLLGTPFQKTVWKALMDIPHGETRSYGEVARAIGRPGASRAVGMANHANPLAVVVPCHRVVGHDGKLVGYGGGLERKRWLLELEGAI